MVVEDGGFQVGVSLISVCQTVDGSAKTRVAVSACPAAAAAEIKADDEKRMGPAEA